MRRGKLIISTPIPLTKVSLTLTVSQSHLLLLGEDLSFIVYIQLTFYLDSGTARFLQSDGIDSFSMSCALLYASRTNQVAKEAGPKLKLSEIHLD
jgi:hypothetical protein